MGKIDGAAVFATVCTAALWWYTNSVYLRMLDVRYAVEQTFVVGKSELGKDFAFDNEDTKRGFIRFTQHLLKPYHARFEKYENAPLRHKLMNGLSFAMNRIKSPLCGLTHDLAQIMDDPEFGDRDVINSKELANAEARPEKFAECVRKKMGSPVYE